MAVSDIKMAEKAEIEYRMLSWTYNAPANNTAQTSLKSLIDADLPSGYKFGGLAGFSTNNTGVLPMSIMYSDSTYSLRLRNITNAAVNTSCNIMYVAIKN